ncbi:hypothetical protein FRC19_002628 [Serendipita sp. 401]|nr:hypothetical protein FRC19_002628 [Serendipita sp. 401]KAG8844835.1 hypothetical protein FRC20_003372 [Serendipita sp. 405]
MSTTTTPTIHLPPDVLKSLIEVFRNMGVARYTSTAGLVAMLYDWFLTVEDEIEVIWRKRMTLTSVLYLIVSSSPAIPIIAMRHRPSTIC